MSTVIKRLKAIDDCLDALLRRFDVYTDLVDGAPPHPETLNEDHAMLREARIHMRQLRLDIVRERGESDVND